MCLEQAKLGKWEEPCSAARCMQSRGICRTASQLCTRWPCEMAEALRASYACPLCSPARARQPSVCRASGCAPPAPAVLPEERRERTNPLLWPQFLKQRSHRPRAQSKTIEVNLQVSIVVWGFFSPFLLCKLSLLVLFSTGLANVLLLQLKLCPVTELHTGFA